MLCMQSFSLPFAIPPPSLQHLPRGQCAFRRRILAPQVTAKLSRGIEPSPVNPELQRQSPLGWE